MNNVKIGVVLIIISLLFGALFFSLLTQLKEDQMELGCVPAKEKCLEIDSNLSVTHIGIGIIAAAFTLGIYIIFFSKGEQAILKRLEEDTNKKLREEKFGILLRAFDENEQTVLKAIKAQAGIEQNTLRLKTGLSKAKVSQILTSLEKKRLIQRKAKNKTFSVWLSEEF
jgi:uncharacterized membrane protein